MPAGTQTEIESPTPLAEVASIIAAGLLRRRALETRIATPPKTSEESTPTGLALPADLPLSGERRTRG